MREREEKWVEWVFFLLPLRPCPPRAGTPQPRACLDFPLRCHGVEEGRTSVRVCLACACALPYCPPPPPPSPSPLPSFRSRGRVDERERELPCIALLFTFCFPSLSRHAHPPRLRVLCPAGGDVCLGGGHVRVTEKERRVRPRRRSGQRADGGAAFFFAARAWALSLAEREGAGTGTARNPRPASALHPPQPWRLAASVARPEWG